jgi:hypothetical protein
MQLYIRHEHMFAQTTVVRSPRSSAGVLSTAHANVGIEEWARRHLCTVWVHERPSTLAAAEEATSTRRGRTRGEAVGYATASCPRRRFDW